MIRHYSVNIVLIACSVLLLYPVVFTHDASFFIKQDNLHQAFPWYNKLASSLHKGYLPIWDANTFGGKNFAGEAQTGIFYPLNIIWCLLFGSATGIRTYYLDLLVCLHYLIALLGMYRLARVLKLSAEGSLAAALVFAFAGCVGARAAGQTCIFFGLTLLPWVIYFIARYYCVKRKRRYLILAGAIGGLQLLAGHVQPFFHTMMITGIMVLYYEYPTRRNRWSFIRSGVIQLSQVAGMTVIVALPQIYYSAQYLSRCYRTVSNGIFIAPGQKVPLYIYSHWFIIHWSNLGNFLAQEYAQPDDDNSLYMGILPLVLVLAYLIWPKKAVILGVHRLLTRSLWLIFGLGLVSAMGYQTYFYMILYHIPFVNLVRQLGRYIILVSFSLSLLTGLAITYMGPMIQWLIPAMRRLIYLPAVAVTIIFIDLLLHPVGYLSTQTMFYPDEFYARNRLVDTLEHTYGKYRVVFDVNDYALVRRNLGDIYSIQTKWGYGATINKAYSDFANIDQRLNSEVNDLLNVRYVITDKQLDPDAIFRDSSDHLMLYERRTWYPRCYWKRQLGEIGAQIEAENKEAIHSLLYSDNEQRLEVSCERSDTLIFSENDYPGWVCYDNGKKIAIYTASIKGYPPLFRSIFVTKGWHSIDFRYR
jgi:hypothetical protein